MEHGGDLGDSFFAGVVQLLGELGLVRGEPGSAAASAAAGAGSGEPLVDVGDNEIALKFGHGG